ncbi:MAG: hypothetical protein ACXWKR_10605 [Phenylobacterium sp.]
MTKTLSYAAFAAAVALSGPCLAQSAKPAPATQPGTPATTSATTPSSPAPAGATPSTTNPATPPGAAQSAAPTGSSADTAAQAGSATLMTGMSVKDNTGALIGEVKAIKGSVATISMGSDTFTVDSDKLGVSGGAATINATQAEIKKMLPKK